MNSYIGEERWLPVPDWEGLYEVSDHGRVRSLARTIIRSNGRPYSVPERILTERVGSMGYPQVSLCRDNKIRQASVHVLVLEAFDRPRPEGHHACHWDDIKTNNHVSNLRWGTPSDNAQDALRNGHNHYAKRDECINGHPFSGDNLVIHGNARRCKTCLRENAARRAKRMRSSNG